MTDRRPNPRPGKPSDRRGPKPGGPARRARPGGSPAGAGKPPRPGSSARGKGAPKGPPRAKDDAGLNEVDRLQKRLAHAGVGSRRACEELISQGRVTVNGQVVSELGTRVPRDAKVALDGQKVQLEKHVYFAVHKPKGYVSTNHDPAGKPRVVDLLPEVPQRVYSVGRLDEQSTGLMLLSNDGELANKLAHPKFGVEKVYRVVVAGSPGQEVLRQLTDGIWLAEGKVRAKRVKVVGNRGQASVMEMVLAEGKNREIRRMLAKLGHKVMSLTRIAIGPIGLKGLGVGEFRPLSAREVDLLQKVAAGLFVPTPQSPDRRDRTPRPPRKGAGASHRPREADANSDNRRPSRPGHSTPDRRPSGPPRPDGPPPSMRGDGPPRPHGPRTASGPGRPQGQRPGGDPGRPRGPYADGPGRPQQDQQRPSGPGRPQGQRPPGPGRSGQGRPSGPSTAGPGATHRPLGPPPSARPRRGAGAGAPDVDQEPRRRIIGMEEARSGPAPERSQGGPKGRRPMPRKPPRASQGLKRKGTPPEAEG